MKRFILTGAPGSGKTTLIERLAALGYPTVREGFMDLYRRLQGEGRANPFEDLSFIEKLVLLQSERLRSAPSLAETGVFLDRSPLCTLALNRLMGRPLPDALRREAEAMAVDETYARRVFLIQNLGWVVDDGIRTLDLDQTLAFEALHREVYHEHGYECIDIPAMPVDERVRYLLDRYQEALHASDSAPSTRH